MSSMPWPLQHLTKFGRCSVLQKQVFSLRYFSWQPIPTHPQQDHIILQKCMGERECSLAVWLSGRLAGSRATWDSFSGSRELLSCRCSLTGCTRRLGRQQTGNTQQVDAMAVYLSPFIRPRDQTGQPGPGQRQRACQGWT